MRRISIICLLLPALLTACTESSQGPGDYYYSPDVPPGVNVYYYDWSDGIAPDTVYFQALVGEWNRVDTLFYMLAEGERVIVENWWIDNNVELAVAYDPLEDIEYVWRAWMAGDTAELVWTP